ncbi:mRNA turnover protein-like protein 4 [Microthyrium microscopicum]|uniref:Ribosome assembly factor mrt4 n=1 Tax=Microthyrium microscopicum TaxID=703497 RepID=A0A6A6U666_9PEZI|nr:mRNA turnover protein-like protein 4 [Microthyrium microscopicum]
MPKSRRAKVVHLSKVEKKGKELSEKLYNGVREAADEYPFVFVFQVENMRNNYLKEVRTEFSDSRIFFGKTKVMAKSLGSDPETEYLPGLATLTPHMRGDIGLLFTARPPADVLAYFSTYAQTDFARAGVAATHTFTVPAGIVYSRGGEVPSDQDVPVPHSVETTLRKWGMPTKMDKGKVVLDNEYVVCKEGQVLDSHQTSLLKMFGVAMAEFRIRVVAYWIAAEGKTTVVESEGEAMRD